MASTALVVCGNPGESSCYAGWLRSEGYDAVEAPTSAQALTCHRRRSFPLTLAELCAPLIDGVELISEVHALNPEAQFLLLADSSDPPGALVAAMRAGAADLLVRPIERQTLIEHVSQVDVLKQCDEALAHDVRTQHDFTRIVGDSHEMLHVLSLAARVADHDTPVLITGESGTGKELLARAIHCNSTRAQRAMVSINCAAIPEPLLESELFGYRRGAFTGATANKPGLLTTADGGTLFLDEIAELPLATQAKLLRFLEDGTFFALGAVQVQKADVRLIAATNAALQERVARGAFRRDLYYRLSVFPLHIPPLRERPQDIVPLAHEFLRHLGHEVGKKVPGLSREAVTYIRSRAWLGNARELRNAIERAVIVSAGNLLTSADFRTLEANGAPGNPAPSLWEFPDEGVDLRELNRSLIRTALDRAGHNVSAAARLLRISRPALRYYLEKHDTQKPRTKRGGRTPSN